MEVSCKTSGASQLVGDSPEALFFLQKIYTARLITFTPPPGIVENQAATPGTLSTIFVYYLKELGTRYMLINCCFANIVLSALSSCLLTGGLSPP